MDNKPIYRTAEQLGIAEVTRQGLIQLARDLADGAVPPEQFYMEDWCGSACCIGGHLDLRRAIVREDKYGSTDFQHSLERLFYPAPANGGGDAIDCRDPAKGAAAIVNFLVTGDPQWARVMESVS